MHVCKHDTLKPGLSFNHPAAVEAGPGRAHFFSESLYLHTCPSISSICSSREPRKGESDGPSSARLRGAAFHTCSLRPSHRRDVSLRTYHVFREKIIPKNPGNASVGDVGDSKNKVSTEIKELHVASGRA